jgi:segregation and condensation protein B
MELTFILEAILFSAQQPMSPKELRDVLVRAAEQAEGGDAKAWKKTSAEDITRALEQLAREHEQAQRSYRLACVAGSWQFVSQPEFSPWIKALVGHKGRPPRLSQPGLETLAIIAYRQPITRAEIEQVRGVAVDGVLATLLERGLIEQVGRAEVVGRPMTYGTTPVFLEYFGLGSLEDLPAADELRRVPIAHPETLVTAEPGLATVPPEQLAPSPSPAPQGEAAAAPPAPPADAASPQESPDVAAFVRKPDISGTLTSAATGEPGPAPEPPAPPADAAQEPGGEAAENATASAPEDAPASEPQNPSAETDPEPSHAPSRTPESH